jgi:hypothetical protein
MKMMLACESRPNVISIPRVVAPHSCYSCLSRSKSDPQRWTELCRIWLPETSRTPAKILAHIGDLMDWGLAMSEGRREWKDSLPLPWEQECERFFAALKKFDDYLASEKPLQVSAEKLFQGPIADALTHVGQIAMLRRMAGVR